MDFSNISEGQVFKNYKELCNAIGIVPKRGDSKTSQINEIRRYCSLEKVDGGHRLVISEIYEEPVEKVETRGRKSVYGEVFTLAISDYLLGSGVGQVIITKNNLLQAIKAINENYTLGMRNIEAVSMLVESNKSTVAEFYGNSGSMFNYIIDTSLSKMEQEGGIVFKKTVMVGANNMAHREATNDDMFALGMATAEVLEELEMEKVPNYPASNAYKLFNKRLKEKLMENGEDFTFSYKAYSIVIIKDRLEKIFHKNLRKAIDTYEKEKGNMDELNQLVCERILNGFVSRREKEFNSKESNKIHRTGQKYLPTGEKLIDLFIKNPSPIENVKESIIERAAEINKMKNFKWGFGDGKSTK